jgi:hypothetical protein
MGLLASAGVSALGSILGGKGQSKAAKRAAEMAQQNTQNNNALAERFYSMNREALSPWMLQGLPANSMMNELLGMRGPSVAPMSAFGQTPAPQSYAPQSYAFANQNEPTFHGGEGGMMPTFMEGAQSNYAFGVPVAVAGGSTDPGMVTAPTARSAFDNYRNSTGYQFRMGEGVNALQKAFGRSLDSGAFGKAAMRFGSGIASDEFGKYMQLLDNQQRLGFGAASALTGVNQNMASTLTANNNAGTSAGINARLYQGQSNANMWNSLGSSFGEAFGKMKW